MELANPGIASAAVAINGNYMNCTNLTSTELAVTIQFFCEDDGISEYYITVEPIDASSASNADKVVRTEANCSESVVVQLDYYGDFLVQILVQHSEDIEKLVCSLNMSIVSEHSTDYPPKPAKSWSECIRTIYLLGEWPEKNLAVFLYVLYHIGVV